MMPRVIAAFLLVAIIALPAGAQLGVEAGALSSKSGAVAGAFGSIGVGVARIAGGALSSLPGDASRVTATSGFALGMGRTGFSRNFVARGAGSYVAGVQWRQPRPVQVVLNIGPQQATGTADAPLMLRFQSQPGELSRVSLAAEGDVPVEGLQGDLQIVREPAEGEAQTKSLFTRDQRLAELTRRGPLASTLPLTANLADRHLRGVPDQTDLDRLFARALASVPGLTEADLRALVEGFDALPPEVRARLYSASTLALRSVAGPTQADVPAALCTASGEVAGPCAASATPGRSRITLTRLECVDESNPEWWGSDDVALLWTAVADGQAITHASALYKGFEDGGQQDLAEADRVVLPETEVSQGVGLVVDLWEWEGAPPARSLGGWALREALANALAAPEPSYTCPRGQELVARELAIEADLVGQARLSLSLADLEKLVAPGQKVERALDLRRAEAPDRYDGTGYYRLHCLIERL